MKHLLSAMLFLGVFCAATAAPKPNILFITLDDMNCDSVGIYGSAMKGTTPNIDRLAAEGLRFEHAHVTIAICQPTRAVWMTGRYPQNSGALGFDQIKPGIPTLPETLKKHGYYTGILGKTEHVIPSRKKAFDYRRGRYEMSNGRSATLYERFTKEFFKQVADGDKPFFLMVNAHDPHRPFDNLKPPDERGLRPQEAKPKGAKPKEKKRKGKKRGNDYPAPSKLFKPKDVILPGFLPDLPEIRKEIAQYYSSVRRADDVVGKVLEALAAAGLADNTLVMLKSDHGIAVPFAKTNCWRHSTRTPWIVRWPGVVKANSHDTAHLVAGVDLAPTLLAAAGLPPMAGVDGRSFLPLLKGEAQDDREQVFTYINTLSSKRAFPMRAVHGQRYGYIWNQWSDGKTSFRNESQSGLTWRAMVKGATTDPQIAARVKHFAHRTPEEFYDYQKDPDALNNLIDDPDIQPLIQANRDRLLKHMMQFNDGQLPAYKAFLKTRHGDE